MKKQPGSDVQTSRVHPVTLTDVARAAGVVPMTASRAINESGYVSKAVRTRVLEAARRMNYRPNMLARSLKQRRLRAIGILLPDIANPFSSELVQGIQEVMEANGLSSFLAGANRSVRQEKANLASLIAHCVDGILVATRGTQLGDEALSSATAQGVPLVTVGRPISSSSIDCVTADHRKGAFELVSHLIELGHRRIAFLGVRVKDARRMRRFRGYTEALRKHRIEIDTDYVVGPESGPSFATQEDGYVGLRQLLRLKKPPTAVFARNDYTAMGAIRAAHELALNIPGDVAIAGFDNVPLAAYTTPPLTTVDQPIAEQGRRAAEFLIERIAGRGPAKRRQLCLECRLVIRSSTARVA